MLIEKECLMKKMLFQLFILNVILVSFPVYAESSADNSNVKYPDPNRWTADIKKFQEWDTKNSSPKDAVLFYGSSSIVFWKTAGSFPDLPVMNRGFGGSYMADAVYYVKELVIRYKPRVVVVYEGDNDIADGIPPKLIHRDFINLADAIHAALPQTEIICLAVKLCTNRWKWRTEVNELNALNKAWCGTKKYITFVDTAAVLLGADRLPKSEYFLTDQLHLNEKGYAQWNALLGPIIKDKYLLTMKKAEGQ
jgi:lysophospholipase L1-like esterase